MVHFEVHGHRCFLVRYWDLLCLLGPSQIMVLLILLVKFQGLLL